MCALNRQPAHYRWQSAVLMRQCQIFDFQNLGVFWAGVRALKKAAISAIGQAILAFSICEDF